MPREMNLANANLLAQAIQKRNDPKKTGQGDYHLRFEIEGSSLANAVIVTINRHSGISGDDCRFILDAADTLGGKVNFSQSGEINVKFS